MVAGQAQQQGEGVVLQDAIHEPGFELGQVSGRSLAGAEAIADLPEVLGSRLAPSPLPSQFGRCDVELLRHEGDHRLRNGAQIVRAEAQVAKCAELPSESQAIGRRGRAGTWPRSARKRVKSVTIPPRVISVGNLSSRSRSASLSNPMGTAVSSGVP